MEVTREFKNISKSDVSLAGGKGASLGEMTQAGIPVPEGFAILSGVFESFIKNTDLNVEIDAALDTVNHEEMHTIENASEKIQALITNSEIPKDIEKEILKHFKALGSKYVAVRSSATAEDSASAAWAGQLDTFLNTTQNSLIENVKKCWASLFTPRAIFYRFEKGLQNQKISVAVIIQKMINSESSGITFSVHPVTQDKNQLIIEAAFGLGEAIVSGSITPDSYVVDKQDWHIIDINVNEQNKGLFRKKDGGNEWRTLSSKDANKQVLNEKEIIELSKLTVKIEKHYGFPVDIEWAKEKYKFYITQSRPITTLINEKDNIKYFDKDDYLLSFWVQGVSIFVTDIHLDVYKELEVLYIIDHGMFKQYFTKKAYGQALDRGLAFYSDKHAFDNYQVDLTSHCERIKEFFEKEIKNKEILSLEIVTTFFEHTKKLCGDYAKMNFEFTDKAFTHQEKNPVIKKNLAKVEKFKDYVRTVMNTVLFEDDGYLNQFFRILGKQFNLSPSITENLTQQEILDLFEGRKPDEAIVFKRQEGFVESYNHKGFFEGKDAEVILQEFKEEASHSDILTGQTASPGKVTGSVKIIPVDYGDLSRVNREIEKMNKGEILVAETTAPELIVACKKAGAIVTDMGGLMSHAAIVSREFRIPCIVGTKNASKILKDGDEVEVDANKGTVKILRRAK